MKKDAEYININTPKYTKDIIIRQYNDKNALDFVFFWKTSKLTLDEGCFSQWQKSFFTVGDIEYFCAEQFMMAYKADLFNDLIALEKILNSHHPKDIKELGRSIMNFDENIWNNNKYSIVLTGNYHKFKQNEEMKLILLNTKNNIIVEASHYDKIWGIALPDDDINIKNPNYWKGENLLGFALMEVRDMLV